MSATMKPLARAILFTLGEKSYAWLVTTEVDEWDVEDISSAAPRGSRAWWDAAFAACARAYRRLQAGHPELDMVIGTERSPVGHALPSPQWGGE